MYRPSEIFRTALVACKFYCPHCTHYVFASTVANLAIILNQHNRANHPFECDTWTEKEICESKNYEASSESPPPYLSSQMVVAEPVQVTLDAKDTEWLSSLGVRW
jgi:hypothetical protein